MAKKNQATPEADPDVLPAPAPRWQYTGPAYGNTIVLPGSLQGVDPRSWSEEEITAHLAARPAWQRYFSRK